MVSTRYEQELLEREAPLAQLRGAFERARDGHGGVTLLRAGAGLGKTSLLWAASGIALEAGFSVLSARGQELEREMSFGIVRQLYERTLISLSPSERDTVLAGAAGLAEPAVVPAADRPPGDPDATVHGLYWLTANFGALAPRAIVIDDAHWADDESLRWLVYLAPRIAWARVLVIVAGRPAEPHAHTAALARLAGDEAVSALELDPLASPGVRTLLERNLQRSPDDVFLDACVRSTGGNPFFVAELARVLGNAGFELDAEHAGLVPSLTTTEVARSIRTRLARLGHAERRLADAVAVLESDAEVRHAAALAGLSTDAALTASDVLIGAEIFRVGRPLGFIHPIARAAVYEQRPAGERGLAHRQAAELLAAEGADAERVGIHLLACEPAGDPTVVQWLRLAADHALSAGAPEGAARYLTRALEEPPRTGDRARLSYELGQAFVGVDVVGASARFVDAAVSGDHELQLLAHRWRAQTLGFSGDPEGAVAAAEQAVALAGEDHELRRLLEGTRDFYALGWTGDAERVGRSRSLQDRARDLQGVTSGERRVLAVAAFDIVRSGELPAVRALEYAGRVRQALATWLDADNGVETAAGIGQSSIIADDSEALVRHERATAEATRRGRFTNAGAGAAQTAQIRFRLGALQEAEADARTSWKLLEGQRAAATTFYWWSASQLLEILIARGQLAEAHELVDVTAMGDEPLERLCTFVCPPCAPVILGELALAKGDLEGGIQQLLRVGARLEDHGWRNPALNPWRARVAPALAMTGHSAQAQAIIGPALASARTFGAPWALGMALRAAGAVADGPAAFELLREAIDVLGAPAAGWSSRTPGSRSGQSCVA